MSVLRTNPCKQCGSEWHTKFKCPYLPKQTLVTRTGLNKIGRVGKETAKAVAKWKRTQQPNHQGYYECYICHKWIPYLMAEHTKSRARHPEFRTDTTKMKPVCDECNAKKGSKDYEEVADD